MNVHAFILREKVMLGAWVVLLWFVTEHSSFMGHDHTRHDS
jgi:hypothetical protein